MLLGKLSMLDLHLALPACKTMLCKLKGVMLAGWLLPSSLAGSKDTAKHSLPIAIEHLSVSL